MSEIGTELVITAVGSGLELSGEIDAHTAPELDRRLGDLLADSPLVELHMGGVTFMDSSGLRVLIAATEACRGRDGDLVLVTPTAIVSRLVEVSGLDGHFTIRADA